VGLASSLIRPDRAVAHATGVGPSDEAGIINAIEYGLAGDGVTDDTGNFMAMCNTGRAVYLPGGDESGVIPNPKGARTYLLKEALVSLSSHLVIRGDGPGKTILSAYGTDVLDILRIQNANFILIEDLTIDGSDTAGYGLRVNDGLPEISGGKNVIFNRCEFKNFSGDDAIGAEVHAGFTNLTVSDCTFSDSAGLITANGLSIPGGYTYGGKSIRVSNCTFSNIRRTSTNPAVENEDADGFKAVCNDTLPSHELVEVTGCRFYDCETRSIKIQGRQSLVSNCHFENSVHTLKLGPEIDIQRGSSVIEGNSFRYPFAIYAPENLIYLRAYKAYEQINPHQHAVSHNVARIDNNNDSFVHFIAMKAQLGGEIRSFRVCNNLVLNRVNHFASLETTKTVGSTRITGAFEHNTIGGFNASFAYIYGDVADTLEPGPNSRFSLNFLGNQNLLFGSTETRQIETHPTLGASVMLACFLNASNHNLDPTKTDQHGYTHIDILQRQFSNGNLTFGKFDDDDIEKGIRIVDDTNSSVWESKCDHVGSRSHLWFKNPNGLVGSINTSGFATQFTTTSDQRLKEKIKPIVNVKSVIEKINPVHYHFINDSKRKAGFLAQELQKVVDDAVHEGSDSVDEKGNLTNPWGVDNSHLMPYVIAALQDLYGKVKK